MAITIRAATPSDLDTVVETAVRTKRKLVIGYILRHHPSWRELIRAARMRGIPIIVATLEAFGIAIVGAAFLLSWAAEVVQLLEEGVAQSGALEARRRGLRLDRAADPRARRDD